MTSNVLVYHEYFKFNWVSCILSGNPNWLIFLYQNHIESEINDSFSPFSALIDGTTLVKTYTNWPKQDWILTLSPFFFFFFFFGGGSCLWHPEILGQWLNPHQSSEPSHCSDNAGSLTTAPPGNSYLSLLEGKFSFYLKSTFVILSIIVCVNMCLHMLMWVWMHVYTCVCTSMWLVERKNAIPLQDNKACRPGLGGVSAWSCLLPFMGMESLVSHRAWHNGTLCNSPRE